MKVPDALPQPRTVTVCALSEVTICSFLSLEVTILGGLTPPVLIPFSSTLNMNSGLSFRLYLVNIFSSLVK